MAHIPGQVVEIKQDAWGTNCEEHPDRPAFKRICSEADSFGAEYMNFCEPCWDEYQQSLKEKEEDPDKWDRCPECNKDAPRLISYRDMDEGMHGPVYEHCEECHSKMNTRIAEEDAFYDNDDYYEPEPDIEYEPEPHYEDVVKEELQTIVDYLKREYNLAFVIREHAISKVKGKPDLSIVLEIKGKKAYQRINTRFKSFIDRDLNNGLLDVKELKEAICGTADDIEVSILNRRISDRVIEGSKQMPQPSFAKLVMMGLEGKRFKNKLSKEFVTPIYSIEIMFCRVYWS